MKIFFRWVLIIAFAIVIGFVSILIFLGLKDKIINPEFHFYFGCFLFILVWITAGLILKKSSPNLKQPFAYGLMAGLAACAISIQALDNLYPTPEVLQKMATDAENEYFLLINASSDHEKICDAAIKAYNYNLQLNNQERVGMFKVAVIESKCL